MSNCPWVICIDGQDFIWETDRLFGGIKFNFIFNYLDDLLVYSRTWEGHVGNLREIFSRLQDASFTLNTVKLVQGVGEMSFLGHMLSVAGIRVISGRVRVIQDFPPPKKVKQVRSFLGMAAFYCHFTPNLSRSSEPLNSMKRKNAEFVCGSRNRTLMELITPSARPPLSKFLISHENKFYIVMPPISEYRVCWTKKWMGSWYPSPSLVASLLLSRGNIQSMRKNVSPSFWDVRTSATSWT